MVFLWAYMPAARENDGLSRSYGMPSRDDAHFALILAAIVGMIALLPLFGPARAIFILAFAALGTVSWAGICRRQIGGHTGDVLGATQQICEMALLIAGAIAI
jgi:adenosylcobinamide-GDP ribazoletransferase